MYFTLYKNQQKKWIEDLNIRAETIGISNDFVNRTQSGSAIKRNDWQMGLNKIKKLLHNKRNGHQMEKAAHRMLCQVYIWQGINNQNIQGAQ
jgi:hypothetical protein